MNREHWARLAARLIGAYPTLRIDRATVAIWYDELADLEDLAVEAAVSHMIRTKPAFPSVADIRQHVEAEAAESGASRGWGSLITAIKAVGYVGSPRWKDPLMAEVVQRLGGWITVCETMTAADITTWRAQFRRVYDDVQADARRRASFTAVQGGRAALQAPVEPQQAQIGPGGVA